jgi:predicted site-specific integrase-resolvase
LEMAQIKLEVTLETSNKWRITGDPILRWQKKLWKSVITKYAGVGSTSRKKRLNN